jgi:hypothetical protein
MTLDVKTRKVAVDTAGVESEVSMDDLIEVGVFTAAKAAGPGEPLPHALRRASHHRDGGEQTRPSGDRPAESFDRCRGR